MLSFRIFENCLSELKEIHDRNIQLDTLGVSMSEYSSGVEAALLSLLEESVRDTGDYIGWWLYEDVEKYVTLPTGSKVDLTTPVALYNFLMMEANYGKDA